MAARKAPVEAGKEASKGAVPPAPGRRVPTRGGAPRRDPLTSEAIVAAAIRVLDAEGVDAISMRRVARELDAGAASLYWHVGSKDGLLDLIFDEVIGEQEVPDPDPERWQEQLREVARTMRATIRRHRDIIRISIGRIPMGPNALEWAERVLAILRAGGVPDHLAVEGQNLLIAVVNGFTIDETGDGGAPPEEVDGAEAPDHAEGAEMASGYLASLPAERFPNLVALAGEYAADDPDARFERLLDIYIGGLAREAEHVRRP